MLRMRIILLGLLVLGHKTFLCTGSEDLAEVSYTVWSGPGSVINQTQTLHLRVPNNSTFYQVMEAAQLINPHYKFESKWFDKLGHYITTINGLEEDPAKNHYWMIYKLEQEPDIANLPNDELLTPKGVDGTYISDGEYYLFWLKEVLWN